MKTFLKTTGWLVMAAALSFGIAACSSDDDVVKQPQNPTEPQVYTLVVKASKGGISTRALSEPGASGIDAYWSGEETIEVGQYNYTTDQYDIIGTATAVPSETGETTITAELTSAPNPDYDLNFFLGGSTPDYTGQVGLLTGTGSISEKYDYASDCLTSSSYTIDNTNNKIIPGDYEPLEFGAAQQAIIKFTLQDKGNENAAISPSALTVSDGTSTVELTDIPASTYTANGAGVLYVAFPPGAENTTITLTATVGEDTYTYERPNVTFYRGQYYTRTVRMTKYVPECSYTAPTLRTGSDTYNGSGKALLASNGSAEGGTLSYSYRFHTIGGSYDGWSDWSTTAPTVTNAGVYEVRYKVEPATGYTGGVAETSLGEFTINKANGYVNLSSYSSSGWGSISTSKTENITVTHHGGTLSYSKSGGTGSGNLSVELSGNSMKLSTPRTSGCYDVTVTVTSAATTNYNAASATYTCKY